MPEPTTQSAPRIDDPYFRSAVAAIDAGDIERLRGLLIQHPSLLMDRAEEDGSFAGAYFARPALLFFVAENPIRNGTLPPNIVAVTEILVRAAREADTADRQEQIDYTLALVVSGCVARKCGVQRELIRLLVRSGANPNALETALAHQETDAAEALLECGAELTLGAAAGLSRIDQLQEMIGRHQPDKNELAQALALAATNGRAEAAVLLCEAGAVPSRYNPEGFHPHCTPLHSAISARSLETVRALITHGADPAIRDHIFHGDARDWAEHFEATEIIAYLDGLSRPAAGKATV